MSRSPPARGFTFLEVSITTAFAFVVCGTLLALWRSSDRLTTDGYVALKAEAEHRRDVARIAAVLRDVPTETLEGLDESGRSTAPRFRRIVGVSGATVELGPEVTLSWARVTPPGGGEQGSVVGVVRLSGSGPDVTVAEHVEEGGFAVELVGRLLRIHLTTCQADPAEPTPRRTSSAHEVLLRN